MADVETRTKDDSTHHVWNSLWSECLRVGFWCQCNWFEFWGANCVRESYSGRVPRSSLAEVHREFVLHIVEDEVDGQENQTHNMSAWRWRMRWCEMFTAHANLETWATHVRVIRCELTRKCDEWSVLFTHPSFAADCYQLWTIWLQKKSGKVSLLSSFVKKLHNGSLRCICRSFTSTDVLVCNVFYELHQESHHCHHDVLDEEDDGCHFWYCKERIGASRSSPDSRWRRCNFVNASLNSERSFIGWLRPDVLREIHPFFLYLKYSSFDMR